MAPRTMVCILFAGSHTSDEQATASVMAPTADPAVDFTFTAIWAVASKSSEKRVSARAAIIRGRASFCHSY